MSNEIIQFNGLAIKPSKHPSYKFEIYIPLTLRREGLKKRYYFNDPDKAKHWVKENFPINFLSDADIRMIQSFAPMLKPGDTFADVFECYINHRSRNRIGPTSDCIKSHLAIKKSTLKPRSYRTLEPRLNKFAETFGTTEISSITTRQIDSWLSELKCENSTRKHYRNALHGLFAHAGVNPNPLSTSAYSRIESSYDPEILTVADLKTLLKAGDEAQQAMFYLGAFAGIRPLECLRLTWEHINLDDGIIYIDKRIAKRPACWGQIKIEKNLNSWIRPYSRSGNSKKTGRIVHYANEDSWSTARNRLIDAVYGRERTFKWPHDGLRHSFCSYHLKHFQDRPRLIEEMRHQNATMLINHYLNRNVTEKDAKLYWKISRN